LIEKLRFIILSVRTRESKYLIEVKYNFVVEEFQFFIISIEFTIFLKKRNLIIK